ncbi:AAA family ATPase, partial [Acidomonas methanolica]
MTAKITRLRITGFKSFADAATIDILPGLTGIVGPNGCGKSNVVEALRWSMGESSARALRGGELDDLIFAGTGVRPARSLAEVTVWLEDATGLAPAPFAESAELEITRRAERGAGSDFRLNGKSVRARDVTTLFADLSSGARSSSIISQNRVSTLIAAKPEERRALLEEAAGISGLHARRHDAELKLRQTEANLARAEDLRVQIEARLESLGEQTAQARRYRELAAALRADEAHLHALLHARAELAVTRTASALAQAQAMLAEAGALAEAAAAEETRHRDALSPTRQKRDTARAALERHRVLAESAAQEEQEARRALDEATRRVDEGAKDEAAAAARFAEAAALLREDIETGDRLEAAARLLPDRLAMAEADRDAAETRFETARGQSEQANEALVQARMARDTHSRRREETTAHLARITAELAKLTSTLDALRADLPMEDDLAALATQCDALDGEIAARRQALAEAESDAQETRLAAELAERALAEGRRLDREREAERQRLSARLGQMLEQEKSLLSARDAATQALRAEAALAEMETAEARSAAALDEARHAEEQARAAASEAATARLEAESRAHTLRERVSLAQRDCTATETALQRARTQADEARHALESAQEKLVPSTEIEAQAEAVKRAEDALAALLAAIARLETDAAIRKTDVETHAAALAEAETTVVRLRAHCEGLAPETPEAASDTVLPLIRQITFPPELARGLAVALADGLDAPVGADESLPLAWRPLPPMTPAPLPPGVTPLNERVEAPSALDRLLASIGVVTDPQDGFRFQPQLQPGQALVTAEGALWRWDGYRIAANRPNHAARQLERHQAYLALQRQIAEVESTLPALRAEADARMTALKSTEDALSSQRRERATTEQTLARARSDAASCANRAASARLAADAAERGLEIAAAALAEAATRAEDARNALAALPALAEIELQAHDLSDRSETARVAMEMAARRRAEAARAAELAGDTVRQARLRHDSAAGKLETLIPALARLTDDRTAAETALAALEVEARAQSLAVLEADAARHGAARDAALRRLQDLRAGLAKNEADRASCATRHTA